MLLPPEEIVKPSQNFAGHNNTVLLEIKTPPLKRGVRLILKIPDSEKSGGSDLFFLENPEIRGGPCYLWDSIKKCLFCLEYTPYFPKKFACGGLLGGPTYFENSRF